MWQKIIGVCIAMLLPLEQAAWAISQRDALAPKSVFSEKADSNKARAIVAAKDMEPYYDRAVRFFSTAVTPQEVAELTQVLVEKTIFSDKPLASERGISRPLIVFSIASAAALIGIFGLYPWSNYWNDLVLAMISCTVAGKSLSDMLSDHFLEGRLMIEDFIFFRWKKILALIALKDSDKQDTLARTHSRIAPDGSRALVSIEYYSGDSKLDRNAAHEAVHALKLLGKLKISTPEHEFVLAHALTALDDLEYYLREMTTHIAPEKVPLKIKDDYSLGYETEPFRRLFSEIGGMILFPTAVPPGSTANSIQQIQSRLSRFSSTFRRHEALLRNRGIDNRSEHLLPLRFKGFIWAAAARAVADRQGGAGLGAYMMLKNLAAAAPNPNDTEFLKLLKQSEMETRAIVESSRQRVQHLPEAVGRQVMDLVLQGSIGPAGKLLPDVTALQKSETSTALSPEQDSLADDGVQMRIVDADEIENDLNILYSKTDLLMKSLAIGAMSNHPITRFLRIIQRIGKNDPDVIFFNKHDSVLGHRSRIIPLLNEMKRDENNDILLLDQIASFERAYHKVYEDRWFRLPMEGRHVYVLRSEDAQKAITKIISAARAISNSGWLKKYPSSLMCLSEIIASTDAKRDYAYTTSKPEEKNQSSFHLCIWPATMIALMMIHEDVHLHDMVRSNSVFEFERENSIPRFPHPWLVTQGFMSTSNVGRPSALLTELHAHGVETLAALHLLDHDDTEDGVERNLVAARVLLNERLAQKAIRILQEADKSGFLNEQGKKWLEEMASLWASLSSRGEHRLNFDDTMNKVLNARDHRMRSYWFLNIPALWEIATNQHERDGIMAAYANALEREKSQEVLEDYAFQANGYVPQEFMALIYAYAKKQKVAKKAQADEIDRKVGLLISQSL